MVRAESRGVLGGTAAPHHSKRDPEPDSPAGQVIAELTGEDVRLAARTASTLQRYETARRDYESRKNLYEDGLISESEFNQVESTLADAKVEWERSLLTEDRSRLVSPIAGVTSGWLATTVTAPWPTATWSRPATRLRRSRRRAR